MGRMLGGLLLGLLSLPLAAVDLTRGQWLDLTHDFAPEAIYWPTATSFRHSPVFVGQTEKGFYYSAYNFCAAEHGGTHVDAPVHFAKDTRSVHQLPVQQLIGQGVVIRVAERIGADRNYQITVEDILAWEAEHGTIPTRAIVLFDTGSAALWPDKQRYMGTAERGEGAVAKLAFPGIHPQAAALLVKARQIKAVGLDTPSIDFGGSTHFESHQILARHNIPGFENVANLDSLPIKGFWIIALPMKIRGGSGAPLRIVAFVPEAQ